MHCTLTRDTEHPGAGCIAWKFSPWIREPVLRLVERAGLG